MLIPVKVPKKLECCEEYNFRHRQFWRLRSPYLKINNSLSLTKQKQKPINNNNNKINKQLKDWYWWVDDSSDKGKMSSKTILEIEVRVRHFVLKAIKSSLPPPNTLAQNPKPTNKKSRLDWDLDSIWNHVKKVNGPWGLLLSEQSF